MARKKIWMTGENITMVGKKLPIIKMSIKKVMNSIIRKNLPLMRMTMEKSH